MNTRSDLEEWHSLQNRCCPWQPQVCYSLHLHVTYVDSSVLCVACVKSLRYTFLGTRFPCVFASNWRLGSRFWEWSRADIRCCGECLDDLSGYLAVTMQAVGWCCFPFYFLPVTNNTWHVCLRRWSNSNASDVYTEGSRFESRRRRRLPPLRFLMILFVHHREYLKCAMAALFPFS
jgi:hypothetical protein